MNLLQIESRLFELEQEKQKLIQLKNEFVSVPQTLLGWNITKSNDYYKLFKRIDKKKVGIHHGRIWNEKKARRQIRQKEQELGLYWFIFIFKIKRTFNQTKQRKKNENNK